MDRIYYFMIAKEEAGGGKFPVFRKEIGPYEVYYLQVPENAENGKFASLKAYMEKGVRRIHAQYHREGCKDACQVWDRDFETWLLTGNRAAHWLKAWDLPLYREYKEVHNLLFLLQQIPVSRWPVRLLILGEAPGLADWLECLARHMKDITIYGQVLPREFETLRQTLLEEYGLLVRWEKSLQPAASEPALVLDYSGREKIYAWDVVPGSIWIDMMSMETRRHALEDRETGVYYLSLKCIWRREIQQTLDTMRKIQYNIGVKLSGKVGLLPKNHV